MTDLTFSTRFTIDMELRDAYRRHSQLAAESLSPANKELHTQWADKAAAALTEFLAWEHVMLYGRPADVPLTRENDWSYHD